MKLVLCILCVSVWQFDAMAQIVTDRPSQSYGPYSLEKGTFQQESSVNYTKRKGFNSGEIYAPVNFFRIGLGKGLELRTANGLSFTNLDQKVQIGFAPFRLGLKAHFTRDAEKRTQIGLLFHGIAIPGLNAGHTGYYGGDLILSIRHQLGTKHGLLYNFAYQGLLPGTPNQLYLIQHAHFTLCYIYHVSDRFSAFAETYGIVDDIAAATSESYQWNMDAGISYLVRPRFQVDYSFGLGFLDLNYFHEIGLSYCIPSKHTSHGNP